MGGFCCRRDENEFPSRSIRSSTSLPLGTYIVKKGCAHYPSNVEK